MTTQQTAVPTSSKIKVLNDKILFKFVDKTKRGFFVDEHNSGIIIDRGGNSDYSAQYCRIGKVVAVGEKASQFAPGDEIAIQALMWTAKSFDIDGEECWMTETRHVIGVL